MNQNFYLFFLESQLWSIYQHPIACNSQTESSWQKEHPVWRPCIGRVPYLLRNIKKTSMVRTIVLITKEALRITNFGALPRNYWIRNSGDGIRKSIFRLPARWLCCTGKFENHWSRLSTVIQEKHDEEEGWWLKPDHRGLKALIRFPDS